MTQPNFHHYPHNLQDVNSVPLNQPLYGATFGEAVSRFFKKALRFNGYASRSEYWWSALFLVVVFLVLMTIADAIFSDNTVDVIEIIFMLAIALPNISVSIRRLHDAGFSGWFYLLNLIPIFGSIVFIILVIIPTDKTKRRPEWNDMSR